MKEKKTIKKRLASLGLCLAIAASLGTPAGMTFCEPAYAAETEDVLTEKIQANMDAIAEAYSLEDAPAPVNTEESSEGETPVEPELPAEPEIPVENIEPVQPEIPAENPEPAQPETPTENPEPAQPETPAENTEPTQPETPAENTEPTQPETPTENPEPAQPETPTEDENPAQPETPTEGENLEQTEKPAEEEEKKDGEEEKKEEEAPVLVDSVLEDVDIVNGTKVTIRGLLPEGAKAKIALAPAPEMMMEVLMLSLGEEAAQKQNTQTYDVSIVDAEGKEIEPTGPVSVEFKFTADSPLSAPDAQITSIVHFKEDAKGEIYEAEPLTPVTAAEADGVKASIQTESFSTFVITWTNEEGTETWFTVNFNYVNTDGVGIDANVTVEGEEINKGEGELVFDENMTPSPIGGLVFKEARVGDALSGLPVTSMKVEQFEVEERPNIFRPPVTKIWGRATFYNGTTEVAAYDSDQTDTINVYLVYGAENGNSPTAPNKPILEHNKTAKRQDDGSYDITLDVKGKSSAAAGQKNVDVLFILDKSGSMKWPIDKDLGPNESAKFGERRWDYIKDAIGHFADDLDKAPGIDARFDVVAFSEYPGEMYREPKAFVGNVVSWTENAETVIEGVNDITPDLGTNYQGGIYEGIEALKGTRSDAEVVVVFLTDGNPTYRGGMNGSNQYGNGVDDGGGKSDWHFPDHQSPEGANIAAAEEQIKAMSCNQFYVIGVGPDFNTETGYSNLERLLNSANAATKPLPPQNVASKDPNEQNPLNHVFDQIEANAKKFEVSSVTIEDNLSQYVDPVEGEPLKIEVTYPDKTKVELEDEDPTLGVIRAKLPETDNQYVTASIVDKKVVMNFPADYKLKDGWTYSVTVKVKPTQQAYTDAANGYPILGEDGTGTHEGKPGLPSNDSAVIRYSFNNGPTEPPVDYPDPVIQVYPGTLVIQKTITGLEGENLTSVQNKLYFEVKLVEGAAQTTDNYYLKDAGVFTPTTGANGEYIYTKTITNLIPGTAYSVVEHDEGLAGYSVSTKYTTSVTQTAEDGTVTTTEGAPSASSVPGNIVEGETTTVSVVNEYTEEVEETYQITVNKHLTKINHKMGDDATFLFEVVTPDGTVYTRMMNFTNDDSNGSFTITGLPKGAYTVRELPVTGYVETSKAYEHNFSLGPENKAQTVSFENKPTSGPDTPYGDSSSAKNMLTWNGEGWVVTQDNSDGNQHS